MLITRYAKIIMSLVLAAFCLLVTFDNITDYGTNYLFVQHVMSMDTTYPGNALMYRLAICKRFPGEYVGQLIAGFPYEGRPEADGTDAVSFPDRKKLISKAG